MFAKTTSDRISFFACLRPFPVSLKRLTLSRRDAKPVDNHSCARQFAKFVLSSLSACMARDRRARFCEKPGFAKFCEDTFRKKRVLTAVNQPAICTVVEGLIFLVRYLAIRLVMFATRSNRDEWSSSLVGGTGNPILKRCSGSDFEKPSAKSARLCVSAALREFHLAMPGFWQTGFQTSRSHAQPVMTFFGRQASKNDGVFAGMPCMARKAEFGKPVLAESGKSVVLEDFGLGQDSNFQSLFWQMLLAKC